MPDPAIPSIETDRLRLVSLGADVLRMVLARDLAAAGRAAGFTLPESCSLPGKDWVPRRIRMIEADPAQRPWLNRAVVRKHDNTMVGYISFHHRAPDPSLHRYSQYGAELGYTIEPEFRREGYATESAAAMMRWAHREHGVRTFVLCISPHNLPSIRMAGKMGFRKVGEEMDEVDGLEYVLRAGIDEIDSRRKHDGVRG